MYKYNYAHLLFVHYIQICQKINFFFYIEQKRRLPLALCVHILNFYLICTHKNAYYLNIIKLTKPDTQYTGHLMYKIFENI